MDKKDLQSTAEKMMERSSDMISGVMSNVMSRVRPKPRRTGPLWFLAGLAGGAAAVFFLDPRRGAARRQMAVDQLRARGADVLELSGKKARHLRNKAVGVVAEHRPEAADSTN